jgi:DinB superfamily
MADPIEPYVEPWMRGPLAGVDPLLAPLVFCFQHAREDVSKYASDLSVAQLWARPYGFGSVGFHIRHAGAAADRLCTYLEDNQLSTGQLDFLRNEMAEGASFESLFAELDLYLNRVEAVVSALNPDTLREPRTVGRKRLPTTVIGLVVHICEHTQRHVGQAISASKLARQL